MASEPHPKTVATERREIPSTHGVASANAARRDLLVGMFRARLPSSDMIDRTPADLIGALEGEA